MYLILRHYLVALQGETTGFGEAQNNICSHNELRIHVARQLASHPYWRERSRHVILLELSRAQGTPSYLEFKGGR